MYYFFLYIILTNVCKYIVNLIIYTCVWILLRATGRLVQLGYRANRRNLRYRNVSQLMAMIFLARCSLNISLVCIFALPANIPFANSDKFRTFSCRCTLGTPGRLQDASQLEEPAPMHVSLPEVHEHLQSEEQPLFAHEVRMWSAAAIRVSLLRIRLEEIIQHTCSCTQETLRLRGRRDPRSAPLTPPRKISKNTLCQITPLNV